MEALMTENLPVFFWFGEIPGLEPILLPAISNMEARVFTSGDFRKGEFFGGQNFAGFLAREESAISPTASCTWSFKPESKVPAHASLLTPFNVHLLTVRSILSTLGYLNIFYSK